MSRRTIRVALIVVTVAAACVPYTPPAPPVARSPRPVQAPFDRTWNAVIDQFAQQVITIETMERASGFIVASREGIPTRTRADSTAGLRLADCGTGPAGAMQDRSAPFLPMSAKYNVLVREAGATSTVLVTARFVSTRGAETIECSSKGAFESAFEEAVRQRAEGTPAPSR